MDELIKITLTLGTLLSVVLVTFLIAFSVHIGILYMERKINSLSYKRKIKKCFIWLLILTTMVVGTTLMATSVVSEISSIL